MTDTTTEKDANVSEALNGVAKLYEENLKNYGQTSKSVGWKDEAQQILRFEKLAELIEPRTSDAGISVNDLGCGYAAMFNFLDQLSSVKLERYYGYDISERMLEEAGLAVGNDSRAVFIRSSKITEAADYSFVSGTFNVKLEANDEVWTEHIKQSLKNLADTSRKGFAFNLLSTYVDWKQENLYYGDPFMFFDFCKRNISHYVSLLHDYPLYEWTIIVRKDSA